VDDFPSHSSIHPLGIVAMVHVYVYYAQLLCVFVEEAPQEVPVAVPPALLTGSAHVLGV
jgi:hypothetical protein